ncbi:hypothetical protein [Micromonospora yangpuensis]|uniref:hypothetical protein n=1 Tax=Micromonospora yangpuensis TaxID=683228 RepID=UPI0015864459|nr:hypothetical protein [Micromonospora yangpuensis]
MPGGRGGAGPDPGLAAVRVVRAGEVVQVTRVAGIQFASRPFLARVIRVRDDLVTYDGWCWLDVYQLDGRGGGNTSGSHVSASGLAALPLVGMRPAGGRARINTRAAHDQSTRRKR